MRFLLNMNLPRALGARLATGGHVCRHVGDVSMATASDRGIVEEAKRTGEVIVTHDLDYGGLLAFAADPLPSVVILRLRNTHVDNLFARIRDALPQAEAALREGAIVVLEDAAIRVRRLPITRD